MTMIYFYCEKEISGGAGHTGKKWREVIGWSEQKECSMVQSFGYDRQVTGDSDCSFNIAL